jgi:hypothetical protein
MRAFRLLAAVVAINGCTHSVRPAPRYEVLPAAMVGDFVDDYGIRYSISSAEWFQRPQARYRIDRIDTVSGYLIARNDDNNPSEKGLWSRIDWVKLPSMAPYEWAFCLSAYAAATREAAEAVTIARKETPRTGCGGYPFSRMRRATPADTVQDKPYMAKPTPRNPGV